MNVHELFMTNKGTHNICKDFMALAKSLMMQLPVQMILMSVSVLNYFQVD